MKGHKITRKTAACFAGVALFLSWLVTALQLVGRQRGDDVSALFGTDSELKTAFPHIIRSGLPVDVKILQTSLREQNGKLMLPVEISNGSTENLHPYAAPGWNRQLIGYGPLLCYATDARLLGFNSFEWDDLLRTPVMPAGGRIETVGAGEKTSALIRMNFSSAGSVVMPPIVSPRRPGPYDVQVIYIFTHAGQLQFSVSPRTRVRVNALF